jgi:integrase
MLSPEELGQLGEALNRHDGSPYVVAAIKLLMLTGARLSEVLGMRWDQVDLERGEVRLTVHKMARRCRRSHCRCSATSLTSSSTGAMVSSGKAPSRRLRKRTDACSGGWSQTNNTSSEVWADTAYRSRQNEEWLASHMLTSRIHRRKPKGKPMSKATARANGKKSSVRARVEHVFAHQKMRFGLFIRTIGLARAETKLTLANIAYNFDRLVFHERRAVTA